MALFTRGGGVGFIGVVHLLPLPGAPRPSPGLSAVIARAVADARALSDGGCDAIIVENLGDAPFFASEVDAWTVAAMTRAVGAVADAVPTPLGVNVLRNDARAALCVAAAVGARFIRVNVHVGVMVTDQGLIEGCARDTLIERNRLGAPDVRIAADVRVKHAAPLAPQPLAQLAADTAERGGADALIVTGTGTGRPADPDEARQVRAATAAPVWVGSGVVPATAAVWRDVVDAAIVGTWLHRDGRIDAPVELDRVVAMRKALSGPTG